MECIRATAQVACFGDDATEARLRWLGHVQRRNSGYLCGGTQVGTGRQEIERKTKEEINGCSEGGREVTQCGERG